MELHLICLGTLKEDYLKKAQEQFLGFLSKKPGIASCRLIELKEEALPETASPLQIAQALQAEAQRIREKIPPRARLICLDIDGKPANSQFFSGLKQDLEASGQTHLVLLIGGSHGIDPSLKAESRHRISFSRLTYPHQLFRIALLDALHRFL
ncbi:Ribosomal RNA large subunit methyltransferase H [anaerobic digester metagenome]